MFFKFLYNNHIILILGFFFDVLCNNTCLHQRCYLRGCSSEGFVICQRPIKSLPLSRYESVPSIIPHSGNFHVCCINANGMFSWWAFVMKGWDPLLVSAVHYLTLLVVSIVNWNDHDLLCRSFNTLGKKTQLCKYPHLNSILCNHSFFIFQW